MNSSLTQKLILRIILIVLLSMVIFTIVGNKMISNRFEEFSFSLGSRFAEQIADQLSIQYEKFGDWDSLIENYQIFTQSPGGGKNNIGQGTAGTQPNPPRQNIQNQPNQTDTDQPTPIQQLVILMWRLINFQNYQEQIVENTSPANLRGGNIQNVNHETVIIFNQEKETIFSVDYNDLLDDIDPLNYQDQWEPVIANNKIVGYIMVGSTAGILPAAQRILLNQITFLIVIMGLFIGALIILITYLQMRRIINPIKKLSESSLAIAEGDLEQYIQIDSDDEIGDLAKAFNNMAFDLKEQQNLRKRTTADIAHELRTPLTVMQIDLESIEDGVIEPDKEVIKRLQYQVNHLGNMVNDLRILSLSDAGELVLEKDLIDIQTLLENFIGHMQSLGNEKQIKFKNEFSASQTVTFVDAKRISQVLNNLLHNALRHSPENSEIIFGLENKNEKLIISVSDQGIGIPQEKLDVIFNRFYRLEEARSRDTGGSGLGLAICKNLVEAHEGKIWAESKQGKGSTFYIELPLKH